MTRHWTIVLACLGFMATSASAQVLPAQRTPINSYQMRGPSPMGRSTAMPGGPVERTRGEQLPMGGGAQPVSPENLPDAFADDAVGSGQVYHEGSYVEGYPYGDCNECYDGSCDSCSTGYDSSGWFGCGDGQFFFTADYLYVRASFSEATAFVEQDLSNPNIVSTEFHQLDFEYDSSYRFGGGWRSCCCGHEFRFLYTRLTSDAEEEVPFSTDIFIPLEPGTPPGGRTEIDGSVDVRSYDLECAKTIPLGCKPCGGCRDACGGCGDGCGNGCGDCCNCCDCPVWDVTWSGGLRVADASWSRSYTAFDQADAFVGEGISSMEFDGAGLKVGLEGRRYFFKNGWLSTYMKGDLSLLVGDVEIETVRTIEGGSVPDDVIEQSIDARNMIPVTELEAGVTGQVSCNARVSAGYLLSAWHDLGYRDEFETANQNVFPLRYDDANILGFDGLFLKAELAY
jgi:hypothetical protein